MLITQTQKRLAIGQLRAHAEDEQMLFDALDPEKIPPPSSTVAANPPPFPH